MTTIPYAILAVVAAFALVYIAARRSRQLMPAMELPPGETIPPTPVQRLAYPTLLVGSVLTLTGFALVWYFGPLVFWDNDGIRVAITLVLVAVLAVFGQFAIRVSSWARRSDAKLDERDRSILATSSAGQAGAMLVTIVAWSILLEENYHEVGQIPSVFLYLIFWSCLLVSQIASVVGILVGYRRS